MLLGTDREDRRSHVDSEGGILIDFEHEDVVARRRQLTAGRGVDCAFDGIGATARQSLRAVRPGGRLVWFGNVAAVFAQNLRPGGKRTSLYSIQTLARRHPDWYRHDLAALFGMLADGAIAPRIAALWTLD